MNRGVILGVEGDQAIILTPQGEFLSVSRKKAKGSIGDEIILPLAATPKPYSFLRKWSSIAIVAASCVFLILSAWLWFAFPSQEAIAYVHIDINPSVELSVNESLEVLQIIGLNSKGEQLAELLRNEKLKSLQQVTRRIISLSSELGYFSAQPEMLVATSFIDEEKETMWLDSIQSTIDELQHGFTSLSDSEIEDNHLSNEQELVVAIHQLKASATVREEAQEVGLSTGRYMLYLGAKEKGVDLVVEEVAHTSIASLSETLSHVGATVPAIVVEKANSLSSSEVVQRQQEENTLEDEKKEAKEKMKEQTSEKNSKNTKEQKEEALTNKGANPPAKGQQKQKQENAKPHQGEGKSPKKDKDQQGKAEDKQKEVNKKKETTAKPNPPPANQQGLQRENKKELDQNKKLEKELDQNKKQEKNENKHPTHPKQDTKKKEQGQKSSNKKDDKQKQ